MEAKEGTFQFKRKKLEELRADIEKNIGKMIGINRKDFDVQLIKISNPEDPSKNFFQFTISSKNSLVKTQINDILSSKIGLDSIEEIDNKLIFLIDIADLHDFYQSLIENVKV